MARRSTSARNACGVAAPKRSVSVHRLDDRGPRTFVFTVSTTGTSPRSRRRSAPRRAVPPRSPPPSRRAALRRGSRRRRRRMARAPRRRAVRTPIGFAAGDDPAPSPTIRENSSDAVDRRSHDDPRKVNRQQTPRGPRTGSAGPPAARAPSARRGRVASRCLRPRRSKGRSRTLPNASGVGSLGRMGGAKSWHRRARIAHLVGRQLAPPVRPR